PPAIRPVPLLFRRSLNRLPLLSFVAEGGDDEPFRGPRRQGSPHPLSRRRLPGHQPRCLRPLRRNGRIHSARRAEILERRAPGGLYRRQRLAEARNCRQSGPCPPAPLTRRHVLSRRSRHAASVSSMMRLVASAFSNTAST